MKIHRGTLLILLLVICGAGTARGAEAEGKDETGGDKKSDPPAHRHDPIVMDANPPMRRLPVELGAPRRLLYDKSGNLIIADWGAGAVLQLSPSGKLTTLARNLAQPAGLAMDKAGNLYVSAHAMGQESAGAVYKITPKGERTVFARNLTGPKGMVMDAKGDLLVACFDANAIVRIDKKGKVTTLAGDIPTPAGLAIGKGGRLYAACSMAGAVYRVSKSGAIEQVASGFSIPSDITAAPDGTLVVSSYRGKEVSRIDAKGKVTTFAEVPAGGICVLFDPKGNLLMLNWDQQGLYKITPTLLVPCPHCSKKIPLHLRPRTKKPPRKKKDLGPGFLQT